MKVNICGIIHEVVEKEDAFDSDNCHYGQIDYKTCEIEINKKLDDEIKKETIFHEMLHGMLVHLGYYEESQDEKFVQALSNAMYQGFEVKEQEHEVN